MMRAVDLHNQRRFRPIEVDEDLFSAADEELLLESGAADQRRG